jgi:hypothetical protein
VKLPLVKKSNQWTRQELIRRSREMMQAVYEEGEQVYRMSAACAFCRKRCEYYSMILKRFDDKKIRETEINEAIARIIELLEKNYLDNSWLQKFESLGASDKITFDVCLCLLGFILKYGDLPKVFQRNAITSFVKWHHQL